MIEPQEAPLLQTVSQPLWTELSQVYSSKARMLRLNLECPGMHISLTGHPHSVPQQRSLSV